MSTALQGLWVTERKRERKSMRCLQPYEGYGLLRETEIMHVNFINLGLLFFISIRHADNINTDIKEDAWEVILKGRSVISHFMR